MLSGTVSHRMYYRCLTVEWNFKSWKYRDKIRKLTMKNYFVWNDAKKWQFSIRKYGIVANLIGVWVHTRKFDFERSKLFEYNLKKKNQLCSIEFLRNHIQKSEFLENLFRLSQYLNKFWKMRFQLIKWLKN